MSVLSLRTDSLLFFNRDYCNNMYNGNKNDDISHVTLGHSPVFTVRSSEIEHFVLSCPVLHLQLFSVLQSIISYCFPDTVLEYVVCSCLLI